MYKSLKYILFKKKKNEDWVEENKKFSRRYYI